MTPSEDIPNWLKTEIKMRITKIEHPRGIPQYVGANHEQVSKIRKNAYIDALKWVLSLKNPDDGKWQYT